MSEWTDHDVATRFAEASRTAKRLPPVYIQGFFNLWPPFVRTEFERLAGDDAPPLRFSPSPRDAERMLEVMHWVLWIEVEQRHLVWMRADRHRWEDIGKRFACAPRTAQRRWHTAIHTITCSLSLRNRLR